MEFEWECIKAGSMPRTVLSSSLYPVYTLLPIPFARPLYTLHLPLHPSPVTKYAIQHLNLLDPVGIHQFRPFYWFVSHVYLDDHVDTDNPHQLCPSKD